MYPKKLGMFTPAFSGKNLPRSKVEAISYLPYFGSIIIIQHDGNYRSVYAIVKNITVNINNPVRAGDVIAKTYENNNGQCFHFELWKDNSPLDPKQWIRRGVNIN